MDKLIITAAICGAEVTKEHNPAVPYTVEAVSYTHLDTRWHRTLSSLSNYPRVDLDLKEVMNIRKEVVPPLNGVTSVTSDLTSVSYTHLLQVQATLRVQS